MCMANPCCMAWLLWLDSHRLPAPPAVKKQKRSLVVSRRGRAVGEIGVVTPNPREMDSGRTRRTTPRAVAAPHKISRPHHELLSPRATAKAGAAADTTPRAATMVPQPPTTARNAVAGTTMAPRTAQGYRSLVRDGINPSKRKRSHHSQPACLPDNCAASSFSLANPSDIRGATPLTRRSVATSGRRPGGCPGRALRHAAA
jgi:hypothetical protein